MMIFKHVHNFGISHTKHTHVVIQRSKFYVIAKFKFMSFNRVAAEIGSIHFNCREGLTNVVFFFYFHGKISKNNVYWKNCSCVRVYACNTALEFAAKEIE